MGCSTALPEFRTYGALYCFDFMRALSAATRNHFRHGKELFNCQDENGKNSRTGRNFGYQRHHNSGGIHTALPYNGYVHRLYSNCLLIKLIKCTVTTADVWKFTLEGSTIVLCLYDPGACRLMIMHVCMYWIECYDSLRQQPLSRGVLFEIHWNLVCTCTIS